MRRFCPSVAMTLVLALAGLARAEDPKAGAEAKAKAASIYDAKADARAQVAAAGKLAERDGKRILVMFGGDWCVWCHRLHDLFASDKAIARILADEYLLVMLDPEGKAVINSDGPNGNIGYPALPEEVAHFMAMLRRTSRRIEPAQLDAIKTALEQAAAPIRAEVSAAEASRRP